VKLQYCNRRKQTINSEGTLKLYPEFSKVLHINPWQFAIESASILPYYKGGIHLDIGCGTRKITASAIGVDMCDTSAEPIINIVTYHGASPVASQFYEDHCSKAVTLSSP